MLTGHILDAHRGFGHAFPSLRAHGHMLGARREFGSTFSSLGAYRAEDLGIHFLLCGQTGHMLGVIAENLGAHSPLWGLTGHMLGTHRGFGYVFSSLRAHGAHVRCL